MTGFTLSRNRPARRDGEVPMINIVFLLLVFFMINSVIAPPEPVAVELPEGRSGQPEQAGTAVLHIDADGVTHFGTASGLAALDALGSDSGPVLIRADASLPGAVLAKLLGELARRGVREVALATVPQ